MDPIELARLSPADPLRWLQRGWRRLHALPAHRPVLRPVLLPDGPCAVVGVRVGARICARAQRRLPAGRPPPLPRPL